MHHDTRSFIRYTIAGRRAPATVMELVQPLHYAPILYDTQGDIVRIEGAILETSLRRDGPMLP